MKKNLIMAVGAAMYAGQTFAASGIDGAMNELISSYAKPIFVTIMIISIAWGLISNLGKIADKDGQGTRKEGIVNMLWIVLGTFAVCAILGGLVSYVSGNLTLR